MHQAMPSPKPIRKNAWTWDTESLMPFKHNLLIVLIAWAVCLKSVVFVWSEVPSGKLKLLLGNSFFLRANFFSQGCLEDFQKMAGCSSWFNTRVGSSIQHTWWAHLYVPHGLVQLAVIICLQAGLLLHPSAVGLSFPPNSPSHLCFVSCSRAIPVPPSLSDDVSRERGRVQFLAWNSLTFSVSGQPMELVHVW